ncbi:MAG: hypothetical protein METHAR1v1_360002 [Methanothrix sp.]|nr:MAG: hypothetical protein METHAR1v1_360002 [Methanothrix sp.]
MDRAEKKSKKDGIAHLDDERYAVDGLGVQEGGYVAGGVAQALRLDDTAHDLA